MLRGKFWLGWGAAVNVSGSEHAVFARNLIACTGGTTQKTMFGPLTARERDYAALGYSYTGALQLMLDGETDPRVALIKTTPWVRQNGNDFYLRDTDDSALKHVARAHDFWRQQIGWGINPNEVLVFHSLDGTIREEGLPWMARCSSELRRFLRRSKSKRPAAVS